jgi:hypothetical protein
MSSFTQQIIANAEINVRKIESDILEFMYGSKDIKPDDPKYVPPADMTDPLSGLILQDMYAGKNSAVGAPSAMRKGEKETTDATIQRLT